MYGQQLRSNSLENQWNGHRTMRKSIDEKPTEYFGSSKRPASWSWKSEEFKWASYEGEN